MLDEPDQIRSASESASFKRVDQINSEHPETAALAPANFFEWAELEQIIHQRTQLSFRELDLGVGVPHIATRPSLAFHNNMPVAVNEAKTMVEQGYRVAFFAPTNGELERLSDVLREYSVPFQLGLAPNEAASPYLAERAYLAGPVASTYLIKGLCVRRGVVFPEAHIAFIGSRRSLATHPTSCTAARHYKDARGSAFTPPRPGIDFEATGDFVIRAHYARRRPIPSVYGKSCKAT